MSDGTLTVQINNVNRRFRFEEVGNTTSGAVFFDPAQRTVIVLQTGDWDLTFNANGFSFLNPPVVWEGGSKPENVILVNNDATTFTLLNAVSDPQEPLKFVILSDIQEDVTDYVLPVDPTILNNPQPGGGVPFQNAQEFLLIEA